MNECTHIGLDVHKDSIAVALLRPGSTEVDERVIPNTPEAVRKLLRRHRDPDKLRVCYEAGPTGYDTHRLVDSLGFECDVIAPSLIPRRGGRARPHPCARGGQARQAGRKAEDPVAPDEIRQALPARKRQVPTPLR